MDNQTDTEEIASPTECSNCRSRKGLIRVAHHAGSSGGTYDRYFCPSCCQSFEVLNGGFHPVERAG